MTSTATEPSVLLGTVEVRAVERLSPSFVRVQLGGPLLRDHGVVRPWYDQRIKLVFPGAPGVVPTLVDEQKVAEGRAMLRDRVASLRHANIYEPQRYRHIVSSVLVERAGESLARSVASFLVVRIMENGETALFATGRYVDRIALAPEPRYEERVAICDSRRFDTLLAIPL